MAHQCLPTGNAFHPATYLPPRVLFATAGPICHPGLDPGSIFWDYTAGNGKTWIPGQVQDDNTDGIPDDKSVDIRLGSIIQT